MEGLSAEDLHDNSHTRISTFLTEWKGICGLGGTLRLLDSSLCFLFIQRGMRSLMGKVCVCDSKSALITSYVEYSDVLTGQLSS